MPPPMVDRHGVGIAGVYPGACRPDGMVRSRVDPFQGAELPYSPHYAGSPMNSETALVVSVADPTPPYEQLRRQLVDLIGSGVLRPGDRLPPLRQIAADLGLAVGTVARTYRELESAGIVVSRRGAGTRVAVASKQRSETDRRQALREQARLFLRRARLLGASNEETCAAFEHALKEP